MEAVEIDAVVAEDGSLRLFDGGHGLIPGERVRVTVARDASRRPKPTDPSPVEGMLLWYHDPDEPALTPEEWGDLYCD